MRQSAADGLGKVSNPAPVRSDATRVTPRAPERNNPNAATISAQPSRARQALNTARNVSTTVDAIASAAEAGVSLRRGNLAGAAAGLGLAGAAAMGVRSARVARSANAIQDAGASANRIRNNMGRSAREASSEARSAVSRESRESVRRPATSGLVTNGGTVVRQPNMPNTELTLPPRTLTSDALTNTFNQARVRAEERTGARLSKAAINRDLSVASKKASAQNMPSGRVKTASQALEGFDALNAAKIRKRGNESRFPSTVSSNRPVKKARP
jgi:hypothetical protein